MPFSSVLGASSVIKPGVCTSTTRPTVPYTGQLIFETDTGRVASWNGSAWVYTHSSGLIKITSQSFTSSTTVSVNNCFTTTYKNYTLKIDAVGTNGAASSIRLRANGVDATTSNYRRQRFYIMNGTFTPNDSGATTSLNLHYESSAGAYSSIDVLGPAVARQTVFYGQSQINGEEVLFTGGQHTLANAYDGFTLIFTNANSGVVDVYGWA